MQLFKLPNFITCLLSTTGTFLLENSLQIITAGVAILSGLCAAFYYLESGRLKRAERKKLQGPVK